MSDGLCTVGEELHERAVQAFEDPRLSIPERHELFRIWLRHTITCWPCLAYTGLTPEELHDVEETL